MVDEFANLHYLEKHLAHNWWTQILKSTTEERVNAIRRLREVPSDATLCTVCKSIDWEYVFLGSAKTGYKSAYAETTCLGSRAEIEQRAGLSCRCCSSIIFALLRDIDDCHGAEQAAGGCVHLDVNEQDTQQDMPLGHKSYCLRASIRPSGLPEQHQLGAVVSDEEVPLSNKNISSRAGVVLIDNDMSMFRSIPPFVYSSRCRKWLQSCLETAYFM